MIMPLQEPYLAQFPWKKAELETGTLFEFSWRYELPIAAEDLWHYMIDSSRLNKAVGYDGIVYSEDNGLLHGARGEGKMREEWIEYPFEWSKPHYVHRMRRYSKGYVGFNKTIFFTENTSAGCALTVYIGSTSAHPLARKLVPGFMKPFEEKYRLAFEKIAAAVKSQKSVEAVFDLTRIQLSDERLALLDRLIATLPENEGRPLKARLRDFIVNAEIDALAKIRPLAVARLWQAEPDEVIKLFLRATQAGVFSLTWNTICPHCRGDRESLSSLGNVPVSSRCDVCDISFDTGEVGSIEVNFRLSGQIADLPRVMYCAAEPSRKTHILAQRVVEPGSLKILVAKPDENIGTRIRYQTAAAYRPATVTDGIIWNTASEDGQNIITVENRAPVGVQVIYETLPWSDDMLTPAAIFRLQEFRDLFSEEHLSTELKLDVGEQTIMFTDLVGSTQFYEEAGDAQAFSTLRQYFQTIYLEARRQGGAVVKTIGDGAMLVFSDPLAATETALALIKKFAGGMHRIRITIHSGRCLAVNLNTGIDYFGRTVNLAAKLQGDCPGQKILCTDRVMAFEGVAAAVTRSGLKPEPDTFEHASFASKFNVFRIS